MVFAWAVTTFPEDTIFKHSWTITGFDKGMKMDNGIIRSPLFKIKADLPWKFFLRVSQTQIMEKLMSPENCGVEDSESFALRTPEKLHIDEVLTPISNYFGVHLCVENPDAMESDLVDLKFSGSLDITQGSSTLTTGKIFESINADDEEEIRTGYIQCGDHTLRASTCDPLVPGQVTAKFRGWLFGTETPTLTVVKACHNYAGYFFRKQLYRDFYTVGKVPSLTLMLTIRIPSEMTSVSGNLESFDAKALCFKHILAQPSPDFSDFIIKCGEKTFQCHKVFLAGR